MGILFDCWHDAQQETPVGYCCICGGEIYAGDLAERCEDGLRHAACAMEGGGTDGYDHPENR